MASTTKGNGWNVAQLFIKKVLNLGGIAGGKAALTCITKLVTGLADTTATDCITVTVPNAAHAAMIDVDVIGILGAGGAIGADEAAKSVKYQISVVRTPGVNAVVVASAAIGGASANVAGATTVASVVLTVSAIAGAVGAVNTFTIKVAVTKTGGASAAHVALISASALNHNTAGITMA